MKKIILSIIAALSISGCGNTSSSSGAEAGGSRGPSQSTKKIQAGESLLFGCIDTFNETRLELVSVWDANSSAWNVSVEEFDASGKLILTLADLTGAPDEIELLHMNISKDSALYARVIQVGERQALYKDGNRSLSCNFE